ncbi:nucleoporin NDC1 [Enterococcus gallinarum]|uniref:nucleoporin NDC1 n=1 Tax=Enterococcus gallinarum TaxID=1353 RepID=UPI001D177A73|nr:nucleoporin NDC1 [Enterococcus gallinarum]MCC4043774.1 nucleoporin NDC1 [Enterococcus gallinarum]
MKRSIKDTFIVTAFLLCLVICTAIHWTAGLILVFLWSFANTVYDMAAKDYQDKEKRLASRPKQ